MKFIVPKKKIPTRYKSICVHLEMKQLPGVRDFNRNETPRNFYIKNKIRPYSRFLINFDLNETYSVKHSLSIIFV